MNTFVLIILSIYLFSLLYNFVWLKIYYNFKNGVGFEDTPEAFDLVATVVPIVNTLFCICLLFISPVKTKVPLFKRISIIIFKNSKNETYN